MAIPGVMELFFLLVCWGYLAVCITKGDLQSHLAEEHGSSSRTSSFMSTIVVLFFRVAKGYVFRLWQGIITDICFC